MLVNNKILDIKLAAIHFFSKKRAYDAIKNHLITRIPLNLVNWFEKFRLVKLLQRQPVKFVT